MMCAILNRDIGHYMACGQYARTGGYSATFDELNNIYNLQICQSLPACIRTVPTAGNRDKRIWMRKESRQSVLMKCIAWEADSVAS